MLHFDSQHWILTFAGSTNHNYSYCLWRTWVTFKYEFSAPLRTLVMKNMLVNLSGLSGFVLEADLMQEHHNKFIEEFIQHKGADYGSTFVREVVSPNVHHFQQMRDEIETKVGLEPQSKTHGDRKLDKELKHLLNIYA